MIRYLKNPFLIFGYLKRLFLKILEQLPWFHFIRNTKNSEVRITWSIWFFQKVIGINKTAYWPMHHSSTASFVKRVLIGKETSPGISPGCYIHAQNGIIIGDYTQIAPNVGIISANHDVYDYRIQTTNDPVKIGKHCWLGMNVVILPGVELGDFTVVGAGSVVTKSFPEGHCVIGGIPARKIKDLDKNKCIPFDVEDAYIGYIPPDKFENYRKQFLKI